MRRLILLICLLLAICGPVYAWKTRKNLENRLNAWIGRDADDYVREYGPPSASYTFQNGEKSLIYREESIAAVYWPTQRPVYGPRAATTSRHHCEISLHISAINRISSWSLRGNACRADKLGTTKSPNPNP